MPNRLIVLDQNKLRERTAPEVVELLTSDPNTHFVLPDIAFIEMTKNPEFRERTLMGSLRLLSRYPSRVHVSKGLQDCFKVELTTHKSSAADMTLREHRTDLRRLLQTVAGGASGADELKRIVEDPDGHHSILAEQYFNHVGNKNRLGGIIDALKRTLPEKFVKDLRAERLPRAERLDLIHERAPQLLTEFTLGFGIKSNNVWRFVRSKPMVLREHYSVLWLALDWIKAGGFESASPSTITNDLIDHEYVITATCFDGILSAERRVRDAYMDLKELLTRPVYRPGLK